MVFITECNFCGKKQDLSRNITLSICCIKDKKFVMCENEECTNLFTNSTCIHELNVNCFTRYSINGNVNDINIIRSNGTTSKGIIRKYEGEIDYWVSEKDDGVYDAMNKGIDLVMGDWVNFINSSDTIEKNGYKLVLDDLLNCSDKLNAIAFGYSYSIADLQGNLVNKVVTPNLDKKWKMPSSHNSIVYKSNVLKKHKFDLSFKCASDFDQLNKR